MSTPLIDLSNAPTARHLLAAGIVPERHIAQFQNELWQVEPDLQGHRPVDAHRLRSWDAVEAYGVWLYVLVRTLKPRVIVETGVQNGCSTEMLLWGIHRNRQGRLYSIDSGPESTDGSHHTSWHRTLDGIPGKNILPGLKEHWELTLGLSRDHLLRLCKAVKPVDFFWHDSDHSSQNVQFEFETVKPFISPGGILCLHDFQGQPIELDEPEFTLVVPQHAPLLRIWKKSS